MRQVRIAGARRIALLLVLAALVPTAVAREANAGAETPITTCGQMVKTNAFLTRDLTCSGRAGVVVGASGITIDLNGFALRGDGSFGRYGVDDMDGFDGVKVENGVVRDFEYGLVGLGAKRLVLSGLIASGNKDGGIFVVGPSTQIQSSRASGNGGDGIYVLGLSATVQSSTSTANDGNGIYLSGVSSEIRSSTASGNAADGIVVVGNGARLDHNRTDANGLRRNASKGLARFGILVFGYTTPPTGRNVARDNSDPTECKPSSLC